MRIAVRVVPKSSRILVMQEEKRLKVYLNKPACDGEANKQLVEVLARYYNTKKYCITIVGGEKCRDKIVEVNNA